MNNTINLISFFQPVLPQDKKKRLEQFKLKDGSNRLDMDTYWLFVVKILEEKAFFGRFSRNVLKRYAAKAEVEYYDKDKIVFL